jgi:hypothetical protein
MTNAEAFPDFGDLYTAITGANNLDEAYKNERGRVKQLATGLHVFRGRDTAVAAQLRAGQPASLVNAPANFSGALGDASAAWESVAKLLNLHEAQTVLLLQRWMRDNVPNASAKWTPSPADLRAIALEFFSQRWHLLLTVRTLADAATDTLHGSYSTAQAILNDLGASGLLTNLLETAASTIVGSGANFTARAAHSTNPPPDGALVLCNASHVLPRWREQATCELCMILFTALKLMHVAAPAADVLRKFADAFLQNIGRGEPSTLQDEDSMAGLVARLGAVILLRALEFRCDIVLHPYG